MLRRTWEQFAHRGYGLANIADFLKINFEHHDALEDAIAAAKVVLHACEKNQITIEDWFIRISQPNKNSLGRKSRMAHYMVKRLVFTGSLSLPRKEAAQIAASMGCHVDDSVTKCTTILVVGTQDAFKLAGYEKSSKHRKTEDLIRNGFSIKILSERDFIEICNSEFENQKL